MTTEQIFKKIYQELKGLSQNKTEEFLKEYTIPSINYNSNDAEIEDKWFASGIEMEIERITKFFDNKVYWSRYKDKYFFSNSKNLVDKKMIEEIEKDTCEIKEKTEEEFE